MIDKLPEDICICYSDISQVNKRLQELDHAVYKISSSLDGLAGSIIDNINMLGKEGMNDVQLKLEIDSAVRRQRELENRKAVLERASACIRMYGMHGLDYSILADQMYYKGSRVKYFLDCENKKDASEHWQGYYQAQQGEVCVMVKRSENGRILYLKVYDNTESGEI